MKKQKTLLRKMVAGAIFLAGMGMFAGCIHGDPEPPETQNVCNVENPLTDLEWLSQIVSVFEADNIGSVSLIIYQCNYEDNKVGFLIEETCGCSHIDYSFQSCDGTYLFKNNLEDICEGLGVYNFENKKIIYSKQK